MELKYKDSSIATEPPDDKGFVEGYASVYGVVDHQNERTMPGAFDSAIQRPNRVKFLWQHDYKKPIGRITKLFEDERGLRFRAKLNLKTDWGRNAYEALLAGDVDANSIGYQEIKGKNAVNDEDGVKELNGINLMEVSTVSFPSNEEAVDDYIKSDSVEEIKGVIPYAKTALAPEGMAWDGSAQIAAADVSDLRAMCACVVGDPNNKTSYKLPHHIADSHACVWAGVRAAYAATQGARGGVQGCNGAEGHLLKHYDDFNKPRPGKMYDLHTEHVLELVSKGMMTVDEGRLELYEKAGRTISGATRAQLVAARDVLNSLIGPDEPPVKEPPAKSDESDSDQEELRIKLSKLNEQLKGIL